MSKAIWINKVDNIKAKLVFVIICCIFYVSFVEISLNDQADDIEMIPVAIPHPSFTTVLSFDNPTFVVIDLETADLSK